MSPMSSDEHNSIDWTSWLPSVTREVEDFLSGTGWDQPPQLFALVPTALLVRAEPELADRLATVDGLTPIAQEPLDPDELADILAEICWPDEVAGCALAQEIVVLPPAAEQELDQVAAGTDSEDELNRVALRMAQQHPDRRDGRLVVAALREGQHCCVLRLRGLDDGPDELVERPDLAPNMVTALLRTLDGE
jgi:hypothetical protein